MTKFLFTTLPSNDLGLLTRSLPIARALTDSGHRVVFCNPGFSPQKIIAEAGFENRLPESPLYYLLAGDVSLQNIVRFLVHKNRLANLKRLGGLLKTTFQNSTAQVWDVDHFMSLMGMMDADFTRVNVDIILELIESTRAEAVVDFWNPFACMAARISGIPLITVIQADMHPQSSGFIWWASPPSDLPRPVPAVNTVLQKYGQPPIESIAELFIGDLTLVTGTPVIDPLPEATDVHYVGFLLWEKPAARLPDRIVNRNTNLPLVWIYTGNPRYLKGVSTAFDCEVILQTCLEALGNEPLEIVLSTGYHRLPRKFLPLPANFKTFPYLPGPAMAQKCDLMIHHGGYGSCQTGLWAGTPALIIPTFSERESNARRLAEVGAGDFLVPDTDRRGRRKRLAADDVRHKVYTILEDPSYAANARAMGEQLKSHGGALQAARLIASFFESPARSSLKISIASQ